MRMTGTDIADGVENVVLTVAQAAALWDVEPGYLNTSSYGPPPRPAWDALLRSLDDWRAVGRGVEVTRLDVPQRGRLCDGEHDVLDAVGDVGTGHAHQSSIAEPAPLLLFGRPRHRRTQQVVGVHDPVRVPLLGQEALPVRGVVGVQGVPRDHRIEMRLTPVTLGPQQPSETLRFLLT